MNTHFINKLKGFIFVLQHYCQYITMNGQCHTESFPPKCTFSTPTDLSGKQVRSRYRLPVLVTQSALPGNPATEAKIPGAVIFQQLIREYNFRLLFRVILFILNV